MTPGSEERKPSASPAYEWNPADYNLNSSEQQRWGRQLIAKLNLHPHERVLDIGCGDGKITAEIAALVPEGDVLGVDSSPRMIEFARELTEDGGPRNLSFEVADAAALPFDKRFNAIFSNAALHWVVDHRPVVAGIARSLRKGGRFLLQMGGQGNADAIVAAFDAVRARPEWRDCFAGFAFPYGFHAPGQYAAWLAEAGLLAKRVELIPLDMTHHGPAGLAAWLRTAWLPYTQRVPADRRELFIQQVVADYLGDHPACAEGRVHVDMVRLEVEGGKP